MPIIFDSLSDIAHVLDTHMYHDDWFIGHYVSDACADRFYHPAHDDGIRYIGDWYEMEGECFGIDSSNRIVHFYTYGCGLYY
jgi:hypothetical protein